MGAMQVTMIDENKYAETMTDVVLPALEQCCEEGWFDPSAAERSAGIEPLSGIMDTGGRFIYPEFSIYQYIHIFHQWIIHNIFPGIPCIEPDCLVWIFYLNLCH